MSLTRVASPGDGGEHSLVLCRLPNSLLLIDEVLNLEMHFPARGEQQTRDRLGKRLLGSDGCKVAW
jgi:hypothetical protein